MDTSNILLTVVSTLLSLAGGIAFALAKKPVQKRIAGILFILGICALMFLIGLEMGRREVYANTPFISSNEKFILTEQSSLFNFDKEDPGGWKPFVVSEGWVQFEKTGDVEIAGEDVRLGDRSGPFLKYELDLRTEGQYASTGRNAIYRPLDDTVIGVIANVYLESEDGYGNKWVDAGFIAPYDNESKTSRVESYDTKLEIGKWTTIAWSMYGSVWWGSEELTRTWNDFYNVWGDDNDYLYPGRYLGNTRISWLGIQFLVVSDEGPDRFKGTVYLDNIAILYQQTP